MIENLSKYKYPLAILFALVGVGFVFMDTSNMKATGGGTPYIKVNGTTYSDKEFRTLGPASLELTQALMQLSPFGYDPSLSMFYGSLLGQANSPETAQENFFVNRMTLRASKQQFGVYPSDSEVKAFLRKIMAFSGLDGEFDQNKYNNFIKNFIGRLGLTESDVFELVSDVIVFQKISQIVGAGLSEDRDFLAKKSAIEKQSINLNLARIDRAPLIAKIEPSEEEIKAFWETVKEAFKTEEQRKFTYLIAKPQTAPEPPPIPALPENPSEEQKTEYNTKTAERDAKIAEDKRTARLSSKAKVAQLVNNLQDKKDLSFVKQATEENYELIVTELITVSTSPEPLKALIGSGRSQSTAAEYLFSVKPTSDPFSKIVNSSIGTDDHLVAQIDEIVPSREKTYEEAREEARTQLIAEKAGTVLKETATKATETMKTALTEGKTFQEAATAAGLEIPTLSLPEVTSTFQPTPEQKAPFRLFESAKYINPGQLGEPILETEHAYIIHVVSREVEKSETAVAQLEGQLQQAASNNKIKAMISWLTERLETSNIERLNRANP